MSLTGRLSAFFLAALAFVLAGFSLTLYFLARTHLYRQLDHRLEAALDILVAATEIKPDGVEWEPAERRLNLGREDGPEQVRWLVRDDRGQVVDRSPNLEAGDCLADRWPAVSAADPAGPLVFAEGHPWRLLQRRVAADLAEPVPGPPGHKYPALVVTAAIPQEPVAATLKSLALLLAGLSGGIWVTAALLGRWVCRRALGPVIHMAAAARAMSVADAGQRLPSPGTGDELEALGVAFNGLLTRLHEALERQRRFTGDASHQLRTPLTAMLGQTEVVLRRDRSAAEYRRSLESVHAQALQLRQIVEMLLFLARADAEAKLPSVEALDLVRWLPAHLERWAGHPRAADLRVKGSREGPVWVRAHPPLLGQLLDNLLDNACKYSQPGTPITLRVGREAGLGVLSVEDEGCGITAEDLPHVFEPFYRSAAARRLGRPGVGLGLAVVQRIATALGGGIRVQSDLSHGSRFTVGLPEAAVPPTTPLPAQVGANGADPAKEGNGTDCAESAAADKN
jgi:heavy metal sensor kinase